MSRRAILIAMTACAPKIGLHPAELCATKGRISDRAITEPTVRAFGKDTGGDAAQLTFTFRGDSEATRELATGGARRQLGVKLRAQDSCNVIYVMWRLDPSVLEISVKRNPGKRTHDECGANGYTKVATATAPALEIGARHVLRAEIAGDELVAWIDGGMVWRGRLPDEARAISGPAGLRSDNVRLDAIELAAPHADANAGCKRDERGD